MAVWTNADGLSIYYGADEAAIGNAGEYKTFDLNRVTEVEIDLTTLTETEEVITRTVFPKGKVLWKVEVITDEVAATGAAIDVGFISRETSPTVNDPNGILAALPTASMSAVGETFVATGDALATYGGALIGTVVSAEDDVPLNITASRTTSTAFTTGHVKLRLYWYRSNVR
jgi:hypothetical protein